jgi:hypothetical protein
VHRGGGFRFGGGVGAVRRAAFRALPTGHANKRAAGSATRAGATAGQIRATIRLGDVYWDPKNQTFQFVLQGGMASGKDILVAVDLSRMVIKTVIVNYRAFRPRFIRLE